MSIKTFERQKNLKALGYTIAICAAILALFILISWTPVHVVEPQLDGGIEVNLGNGDDGMGDEMIAMPGTPTNENITNPNIVSPPTTSSQAEEVNNKLVADNDEPDAPSINTPNKAAKKPDPKKTETVVNKNKPNPKAVVVSQPVKPAPKAKALFKGTTEGTGGNNADSYTKGVMSQGITGKPGIQGKENGTPNLGKYDGNGGTGGGTGTGHGTGGVVRIKSGLKGRVIVKLPAFEDDFNEPAKVAVDLEVNDQGVVTSAVVNNKGTTTVNTNIRRIAITRAKQLKFSLGDANSSGTIILDFKIRE